MIFNGKTYREALPAFPNSVNKCTGCAFFADATPCNTLPVQCIASVRPDFRDIIFIEVEPCTCDNCAQSKSADPKCGLCTGPTTTTTRWGPIK